ncbi:MAG TPA: hypothetical protein PLP42_18415 [Acidobacteriota bacterium]|nr:hypothetical protein [Acidobacteriota bacterium]
MHTRYYEMLRGCSQDDFYQALNDPEHELYEIVWDAFETVVIDPAEIYDPDFREVNQFRYRIGESSATLEFFPNQTYFMGRPGPDPYRDNSDSAGIHLKFSILPNMTCLFCASLGIWGYSERESFRKLWFRHRNLLSGLFRRAKPIVFTSILFPDVEYAPSLEKMLDCYFSVRDPNNLIELQYSFPQLEDSGEAQNFMAYMALLYHMIRSMVDSGKDMTMTWISRLNEFYAGHLPDVPPPLPCVALFDSTF